MALVGATAVALLVIAAEAVRWWLRPAARRLRTIRKVSRQP